MDETVEVTTTDVTFEVGTADKLVITVLSAVAGMVVSGLIEKSYFKAKAYRHNAKSTASEQ